MSQERRLTEAQAKALLNEAIRQAGSQAAFANTHRISAGYLSDVITGRRNMTGKILEILKLTKVNETRYELSEG